MRRSRVLGLLAAVVLAGVAGAVARSSAGADEPPGGGVAPSPVGGPENAPGQEWSDERMRRASPPAWPG